MTSARADMKPVMTRMVKRAVDRAAAASPAPSTCRVEVDEPVRMSWYIRGSQRVEVSYSSSRW